MAIWLGGGVSDRRLTATRLNSGVRRLILNMQLIRTDGETKNIGWLKPLRLFLIAFCIAVILLYPFQITVVPEWKIRFIDEQGHPYAGQSVRQSWKHYTLELDAGTHIDDRVTDSNGSVVFPERSIKASLAKRVALSIYSILNLFVHGSSGAHAYILVPGQNPVGYVPNEPLPKEIIVKRY